MAKSRFSKLFSLELPTSLYGWWLSVRSYWLTREKDHLVFLALLMVLFTTIISVITFSILNGQSQRELTCLAKNIYHEARGEPMAGQFAVAEVTINRVESRHYPDTICEVVYQQRWDKIRQRKVGAFSWTELDSMPIKKKEAWEKAWHIAETVYHNHHTFTLEGALFYHAHYVKPRWARNKRRVAVIGQHIFYK